MKKYCITLKAQFPTGDFKHAFLNFDCKSCLLACCCPCIIGQHVADSMGQNGQLCCLGYCGALCVGGLVSILFSWRKSVDFFSHFFFCLPFNADSYVNTEVLKVAELWTVCFHSAALAVFCVKWIKKSLVRLSVFTREKIKPSIIFSWNPLIIDKLKRKFRYGTMK